MHWCATMYIQLGIKGFNTPQSVCSKTTLITSSVREIGVNPPPRKINTFFLVCQFIDISNQMETTGEVSSVEQKNLYYRFYVKKILRSLILRQLSRNQGSFTTMVLWIVQRFLSSTVYYNILNVYSVLTTIFSYLYYSCHTSRLKYQKSMWTTLQ